MYHYPPDIYTEPEPDADTLANLGPLTSMAGIWSSAIPSSTASPRRPQSGPGGVRSQAFKATSPGKTATSTTSGKTIADRGAGRNSGRAAAAVERDRPGPRPIDERSSR